MSDEPKNKDWPWKTLDPAIERTHRVIAIILGIITITGVLATLLSKIPIPSLDVCVVISQFIVIAFNLYKWRTKKDFLVSPFLQYVFVFMIVLCFGQAALYITREDGRIFIRWTGVAWFVAGCGWAVLSVLAAHARDYALMSIIARIADLEIRTIDTLSSMNDNLASVIRFQDQGIQNSGKHLEIVEHLQKEIESLKENLPKKRKPKNDAPSSTA